MNETDPMLFKEPMCPSLKMEAEHLLRGRDPARWA